MSVSGRFVHSFCPNQFTWGQDPSRWLKIGRRPTHVDFGQLLARSTTSGARSQLAADLAPQSVAMAESGEGSPMLQALVRSRPDEDSLTVSLLLAGRQRNLSRSKDELVEKCLNRIKMNAAPKEHKKDRKKKGNTSSSSMDSRDDITSTMKATLFSDIQMTQPIEPSTLNGEAWVRAKALQVGEELFSIEVNPPTVDKVAVIKRAIAGFPLLPMAKLSFADDALSLWKWSKLEPGTTTWKELDCSAQLYCPTEADVGWKLRVECIPRRQGGEGNKESVGESEFAETGLVAPAPSATSANIRCPSGQLPRTSSPVLRIMSYNILADQYAGSTFAQTVLFNYCPSDCLDPEYRKQLMLHEVLMYNPDIICLQEVDEKVFVEFLQPHLALEGFEGRYTNKMGKVKEGSATFWRTTRFQLAGSQDVLLRNVFKQPLGDEHAHWNALLDASPELTLALQKVTTVAQVILLDPVASSAGQESPLALVNTHLFFHPYAPHIRSMHTAAILEEAHILVSKSGGVNGRTPVFMFVGDLNSDLNDGIPGVVELLRSGKLASDFWDWEMGAAFKWGMEEDEGTDAMQASAPKPPGSKLGLAAAAAAAAENDAAATDARSATVDESSARNMPPPHDVPLTGIDVTLPVGALRSADDLGTPYTNYTSGYKALLDYVWYEDSKMEVMKHVDVPSEEALGGFIPNCRFPSDHLAVVYDMKFKE